MRKWSKESEQNEVIIYLLFPEFTGLWLLIITFCPATKSNPKRPDVVNSIRLLTSASLKQHDAF